MKLERQIFFISNWNQPFAGSAILCRGYDATSVHLYDQGTKAFEGLWWKRKQFLFDYAYFPVYELI